MTKSEKMASQIENRDGWDIVSLRGALSEESDIDLTRLANMLGPKTLINLKNIAFINSNGARAWVQFVRDYTKRGHLEIEECPPIIVQNINIMPVFTAKVTVRSVYGAYNCETCSHRQWQLFEAGKNFPAADGSSPPCEVRCQRCASTMDPEEPEEDLFRFLSFPRG